MISQFFVLSARGDRIIKKDYRNDIVSGSDEFFYRKVKVEENTPPFFNYIGINFAYIQKNQMYFVISTRKNISPLTAIEFLNRICTLFKDYAGVLSEEGMRKNFGLLYEVLDELCDNGCIQTTSTEGVKHFIFNEAKEVDPQSLLMSAIAPVFTLVDKKTVTSAAARRSVQGTGKNEIFVDIIEKLNVDFGANGNIIHSEIAGSIVMKSYLTGTPELKLGLNEDLVIGRSREGAPYGAIVLDMCNFGNNINLQTFGRDRVLSLYPPDGEFTVMNYRIFKEYSLPFRVFHTVVKEGQFRVEVVVRIRADFPKEVHATNLVVRIPIPQSTMSVATEVQQGTQGSNEYKQSEKVVLWTFKKYTGTTEESLKLNIALHNELSTFQVEKQIGPVSLQFEIPMHNTSGLQVRFLKFEERSKDYNPDRWVRYITQANSYVARIS